MYLNMLKDAINLIIKQIIECDQTHNVNQLHFQEDETFPHYVAAVRKCLNTSLGKLKAGAQLNGLSNHHICCLYI